MGYSTAGLIRSPLLGPKGNVEFLTKLLFPAGKGQEAAQLIEALLPQQTPDAE
jgi:hypothetical protein